MKGLSLHQPYATLIAIEAKRIETRSRSTDYRGSLAIHAAKKWDYESWETCMSEPIRSALQAHNYNVREKWSYIDQLPLGAIVAVAKLVACRSTGDQGEDIGWLDKLSENEVALGNFLPYRYGWFFEDVQKVEPPIPCRGMQGLFKLPPEIEKQLR